MSAVLERLAGVIRAEEPRERGRRADGYLPLEDYGAIGDGRSVALSGADGSIDWWCVPNMDSALLFDRLLDGENGGRFSIRPDEPFEVEQRYREASNVLETVFTTAGGRAVLVKSLNSGTAGRPPWAELARRVECVDGSMRFDVLMRPSRRGDTVNPTTRRSAGRRSSTSAMSSGSSFIPRGWSSSGPTNA